jgi:Methyltransferase domain
MRQGNGPEPPRHSPPQGVRAASAMSVGNMSHSSGASGTGVRTGRLSNGLKEFLFQLDGIGRGHLLDMGAARQTTLNFFIERGFKVYTDDLLTTWKIFLDADEQRKKELASDADRSEMTPAARAQRFLDSTLQYPEGTFDAILLWDILDYLDNELMARLVTKLTSLVRDGGVVFAIFHARKPESFHRYRVLDAQNLELIPASSPFPPQRVFQNREISDLFRRFRSSKTFVGRDQLREGLFVK